MAPSHRAGVAQTLFVIGLLYTGAAAGVFAMLQLRAARDEPNLIEVLVATALGVVGSYWGLREAGRIGRPTSSGASASSS